MRPYAAYVALLASPFVLVAWVLAPSAVRAGPPPSARAAPSVLAAPSAEAVALDRPRVGEIAFGDPDAPLTVVEYASLTCPHCAAFALDVWPRLKREYVDAGKVRWIYRDMMAGDPFSVVETMFLHCVAPQRRGEALNALFQAQRRFMAASRPADLLLDLVAAYGLDRDAANECVRDRDAFDALASSRDRAAKEFGVSGTPTFFVAGRRVKGIRSYEYFQALISPLVSW